MFDPYRKWLGVPEGQRPPTHYQLLGISPDERDPEVIDAAVLRQSAFVRNFQTGKYTAEATRLLTEIAAAKLCLIDPEKRARYDAELRAKEPEAGAAAAPQRAAPQSQSPPPQSPPPQKTSPPKTSPRTPAPQSPVSRPAVQVAAPIAPAARPAAAPRRSASAPRMHAAGALQPWAVEPPQLGNFAYAPRAATDKRPLWIGLAVFACLAPLALMVVVLLSRPDDPSVAAADSQPDALPVAPAPAGVDPLAAPPAADRNFPPPVSPLVETTSPVIAFPPVVETSPPANGLLPGAPQFAPPSGPPGMEGARPEPSAPGGSSLEVPDDSQEFIDRIQREARERQREMEREAEQRQREFEIRRRIPGSFLNPFAKKTDEGLDTMFVGHNGGSSQRTIKPGSFLVGISYRLGEWGRERCMAEIKPIFSRDASPELPMWEVARDGYAVGAAKVRTFNYVNAVRLTYMRIREDGQLDPADFYKGEWLGFRGGKEYEITGEGAPIIGIHVKQGIILDAIALVIDRKSAKKAKSKSEDAEPEDE